MNENRDKICLQYLYENNKNIFIFVKKILLFYFAVIFGFGALMFVGCKINNNTMNMGLMLMVFAVITALIICVSLFGTIVMFTINKYKLKEYKQIKENGTKKTGIIITAFREWKKSYAHGWLNSTSGCVSVDIENEIYDIKNIEYNKNFKILEQELEKVFHKTWNEKKYIKMTIYVWNKKVLADLNSITIICDK